MNNKYLNNLFNFNCYPLFNDWTASLVYESACLTTDHEVAGLIPGTSTILNIYYV